MGRALVLLLALCVGGFDGQARWPERIAGSVLRSDGSPAVGVVVELERGGPFRSAIAPLSSTRTDEGGRFELSAPAGDGFRVLATWEGPGTRWPSGPWQVPWGAALDGVSAGRGDLVIVLQRGESPPIPAQSEAVVRGVVLDQEGRPVAARIVDESRPWVLCRSHKDGNFRLAVAPGPLALRAECPGFTSSPARELVLAVGETLDPVVLQLSPLAHLSGDVLDSEKQPLAGCAVIVREFDGNEPVGKTVRAWSDPNGRFAVAVAGGRLRVEALPEGGSGAPRPNCVRFVELEPGKRGYVRLAMGGEPVRVHGRIALGGREPPDARVRLTSLGGNRELHASVASGRYEVVVPEPGAYEIVVQAGLHSFRLTIEVPEGAEFEQELSSPLGRLAGRVRDDSGRALAGVEVSAIAVAVHLARGQVVSELASEAARARTDAGGAFVFELLPGTYDLSVRPEAADLRAPPARTVEVRHDGASGDTELMVRRLGVLHGRVAREDGGPLDEIWLSLSGSRSLLERKPLADGRFELPLEAGRYWISAEGRAGERWFLSAPLEVEHDSSALVLALVPCTFVRLQPLDAQSAPLTVAIEALDPLGRATASRMLAVGVRGFLLRPGSYTLRALHERVFERALEVPANAAELELEWRLE